MNTPSETPQSLLDALAAIFPALRDEWDEASETLHSVMLVFSSFFVADSATPDQLARLGTLINRWVEEGGLLVNAVSTCLLEHLHQIKAWKVLKPHLSRLSKERSRA